MRPKSDKLHTQIGRNYRNTCVRKPNSSAELCEEAFYTRPSNSFNPSRVNNDPTQRRRCTPWKRKTAEGEVISSPSCFKQKPTKFLIIFLKLKKTKLLELRQGRRSTPEPQNPHADSPHSSRNPPSATQRKKKKLPEKENSERKTLLNIAT